MRKVQIVLLGLLIFFGATNTANATLWDRGGGLIYDDVLDITWLQDAHYAYNSGYWDTLGYIVSPAYEGLMLKADADVWVALLEYYDPIRDRTWDEWRLYNPYNYENGSLEMGYNSAGEMGHLFYSELGNTTGNTNRNTGPFTGVNTTSNVIVWSNEWLWGEYAVYFSWSSGVQYYKDVIPDCSSCLGQAWAVMDGDVAAPVPEPSTILLLCSGLVGLAGIRRKFRHR
jgi:hypothetical protein